MIEKIIKKNLSGLAYFLLMAVIVIIIDQTIKYIIRQLGGFYVCNQGISFGIPLPNITLWIIFVFFFFTSIAYCKYLYTKRPPLSPFLIGLGLLIGGALANYIDRATMSCVFDYISISEKIFPIFNFADITIFLGSCLMIWFFLSKKPPLGV